MQCGGLYDVAEEAEMWTTCASFVPRTVTQVLYKQWIHYPMCNEPHSHGQENFFYSGNGAGGSFHKPRTIIQFSSLYLYIKFLNIPPEESRTTYIFISLSNHYTPSPSGYFPGHLCLHGVAEGSYMTLIGHIGNAPLTLFFLSSLQ